jgi:hypothetical protein
MKYLRAYISAWWDLLRAAASTYMVVACLLYCFTPWRMNPLVGLYLFYLVVVGSLAGPIGELLGDKS